MDRFSWSNGLLEINETLVIQQRGVRLYDGDDKVSFYVRIVKSVPWRHWSSSNLNPTILITMSNSVYSLHFEVHVAYSGFGCLKYVKWF